MKQTTNKQSSCEAIKQTNNHNHGSICTLTLPRAVCVSVTANIPSGSTIACTTPAHHLVTAGVSNWGGYALAAAAAAVHRASPPSCGGDAAARAAAARAAAVSYYLVVPTEEEERSLSATVSSSGARDGITGADDGSVDGMPLETHLGVLAELRAIFADSTPVL